MLPALGLNVLVHVPALIDRPTLQHSVNLHLAPGLALRGDVAFGVQPKQEAFLVRVFAAELDHRETVRRTRLLQRAGFPVPQSLEDDDRYRVPWPSTLTWADLETGAFIDAHRNLVLYGAVGTGNYAKPGLMESCAVKRLP